MNKYALNILELMITKEDCANMTIYGEWQGKTGLDKCMSQNKASSKRILSGTLLIESLFSEDS